jgi:CheY-like chemotaxis protein
MHTLYDESEERPEPLRVLVVDDNCINRSQAAGLLEVWKVETVLATDGAEALRLIKGGCAFDLVLMDLQMPVMDGIAATAKIRQFEESHGSVAPRRMPILAFTTESIDANGLSLRQLGFDAVLPKPFTEHDFRSCLSRWCPEKVRQGVHST